jgi:hypothetical protein
MLSAIRHHRVHAEWQRPLSGVHSIMMEKLAQAGEGGGVHAHPPPRPTFTISTITSKVVVYAPAERADTLPLFLLYPYKYSVFSKESMEEHRFLYIPKSYDKS